MRVFKDFNEIKTAVGTEVGVSDWVEVTQERIDQFAEATDDNQWIHVDVERAYRELPGSRTIAHGLLTLGLAPGFIRSVMGLEGIRNTLNYGADCIRPAPVPAGCGGEAGLPSPQSRMCRPTAYGSRRRHNRDQGGKRPACVAEVIALHYR